MVNDPITIGSWALVEEKCEINYVVRDETVEFTFGTRGTNLQLIIDEGALESFLAKGTAALQTLKTQN
jgi:hypothetical protein